MAVPATIVFLHAHPDDEAIFTGGTIARLAAQGHRVVIITATDGAAGLVDAAMMGDQDLSTIRSAELQRSAAALGAARVALLGYGDSGLDGHGTPSTPGLPGTDKPHFCAVPVPEAARRVAEILAEEKPDVFVGYDAAGGYGHPDHVRVHHVAREAQDIAQVPVFLEVTMPREPVLFPIRLIYSLRAVVPALRGLDIGAWETAFTPWSDITYRINTRPVLERKRAALAAHSSQASAESGPRTVDVMLKLPKPVFSLVFGSEWYSGPRNPDGRYYVHPLQSLIEGDSRRIQAITG